jgi:hypothetical protein
MNDTVKTPAHLWIVGGLSALWNCFGAFDYLMSQMRNPAYLAQFTESQRIYFESFPAWAVAFWALGVWGALAGSLLLLGRSRHAVLAFALSLVGLAGSTVFQFVLSTPPADMRGPGMVVFNLFIWAIAIALFLYARKQRTSGVLR